MTDPRASGPNEPAREPPGRWTAALPGFALGLFTLPAGLLQIRSVDFFWHLAAGRWILDHRRLPRSDPFRFTSEGAPWVDHEWGFQAALALVERLGGLTALVWLRAVLVAALVALLYSGLRRRRVAGPAAVLVTLAAVLGARPRFLFRPELASLLGLTLLLLGLQRLRYRAGGRGWTLAGLALLTAAWANLHPGVLVAPAVAGAYLLGAWWQDRRPGAGSVAPARRGASTDEDELPVRSAPPSGAALGWRHAAGVPLLLALAVLVNPWGYRLYLVPAEIARALAGLPATNPDWAPLWRLPQPFLFAALAALGTLAVLAWRARRRLDPATGLATLVLLPLAISSARHQGLLLLAGAFFAGETLRGLAAGRGGEAGRDGRRTGALPMGALAVVACLLATAWCLWPPSRGPLAPRWVRHQVGFGITPGRFPEGAVAALGRWQPVGNLFNDAAFGGYLLWRLYPPRQVFYDTRNEVDPALLRELARARADSRGWEALVARYAVDAALVRYEDRLRPVVERPADGGGEVSVSYHAPSALLFPQERFALVFWDDVAMLFLARRPERAARLAAEEYRFVQPEDWRATVERARADPASALGARAELGRKLAEDPHCRRARALLAALSAAGGP